MKIDELMEKLNFRTREIDEITLTVTNEWIKEYLKIGKKYFEKSDL